MAINSGISQVSRGFSQGPGCKVQISESGIYTTARPSLNNTSNVQFET